MENQTELTGKTALITGSTSGIGLGLAKELAKRGVNIAMNGLGEANDIEKKRKFIANQGVKCLYHGADMKKPAQIKELVDTAIDEFGGIDILINNAGIQHVAAIENFPPEKWDAILSINLSSAFHTIRAALPGMKEKGWGRIINIASAHGLVASPFKSAYIAAKHGLVGLTKTVALEAAQDGVTVNAICPGYVRTPLVEGQIADQAKTRGITEEEVVNDVMLKAQWTKKFVSIEQLAGLTLFLCSEAAENITGAALPVDGGWTAS